VRIAVVVGAIVALCADANAGSWSFSWVCSGACAPTTLDIRGAETGFSDESSCESARTRKAYEVNSEGSAGTTSDCTDGDPASPSSGGASRAAKTARLARAYVSIDAGQGYEARFADGRIERGSSQLGGELEMMLGRDAIGLGVELGLRRDAGTAPMAGTAADPMMLLDLGFGLASSPFALVHTSKVEIRPDLGAFYVWAIRLGCTRCETDFANPQPVEPNQGNTFRLRAGVDIYWGPWKNQGIALDALVQFGKLGDTVDADEPTSVELHPPKVLFRLSYVRRPR
jgi:hypothetical protein